MHCITINFGPVGTIWTFLYKTEEGARVALDNFQNAPTMKSIAETLTMEKARIMHEMPKEIPPQTAGIIQDDFGQTAIITFPVHAIMLEDLDLSKIAYVEKGLHNARTQNDYVKRVQSDPSARPMTQSPGVLSPMGNGIFRQ